ncbi:hypothetical protein NOSIN_05480 [Nocardiopsis sinuspersici]|uniref:HTH araC/xylS-type domain-containing protein n=2 Tax=Nocardiopsidaceae TaxID=83676 RepID=A0A1V3BY07_9ACTN|nr:hypothetical protein NOSIN_05480 [Nocardiopsis sinuspersici]
MMHRRFPEQIVLEDIASEVFISPFHFSRVFSQDTGVSPGKFLTAIRMFEAKKRLIASTMNICDIVHSVGYNSVGTFTSRFTRSVGMQPRQYRDPEVRRLLVAVSERLCCMPSLCDLNQAESQQNNRAHHTGTLSGIVDFPPRTPRMNVLVGAYQGFLPQMAPTVHRAFSTDASTYFTLNGVPAGSWALIAIAMPTTGTFKGCENVFVGSSASPVSVHSGGASWTQLGMRRFAPTDPPLAVTLAGTEPANRSCPIPPPRNGHAHHATALRTR